MRVFIGKAGECTAKDEQQVNGEKVKLQTLSEEEIRAKSSGQHYGANYQIVN